MPQQTEFTPQGYLALCAMEEANEFAQALSKMLRFGPTDKGAAMTEDNIQHASREFSELIGTLTLLRANGIDIKLDHAIANDKIDRLTQWFNYSKTKNTAAGYLEPV